MAGYLRLMSVGNTLARRCRCVGGMGNSEICPSKCAEISLDRSYCNGLSVISVGRCVRGSEKLVWTLDDSRVGWLCSDDLLV